MNVAPSKRSTPTLGRQKSFFEELFGGIGTVGAPGLPGSGGGNGPLSFNNDNEPTDLFGNNAKGDWYFYNADLKSKGYTEFKGNWGNRPNVDNWQRMAAIKQSGPVANTGAAGDATKAGANGAAAAARFRCRRSRCERDRPRRNGCRPARSADRGRTGAP